MTASRLVNGLAAFAVASFLALGAASSAVALPVQHGISFTKGCNSTTSVGQPYVCSYTIRNNVDEAQDTLTITGLNDVVQTAGGAVGSGIVMTTLKFEIGSFLPGFSSPPSCNGIGTGTAADPFREATMCTLPFGSQLNVQPFSFYTVHGADFTLPGHVLTDSAELFWHDLCNDLAHTGDTNCVTNPPNVGAGSQTVVGGASGPAVQHGISFTKGCSSPTPVGQPYACTYSIRNTVDEAQDTLTVTGLSDVVFSGGGNVGSGIVMTTLKFEIGSFLPGFSSPPSCNGIGTGTAADPFREATVCTLPFGSRLNVQPFSFYMVHGVDFTLPGHVLTDSAELFWHDLCDDLAHTGDTNCVTNPPNVGAGSQTTIVVLSSTTSSVIHDAAHTAVTSVPVGATVHDVVTVSGGPGNPTPTGSVTIDWFGNGSCAGPPLASSQPLLLIDGSIDANGFAFAITTAGQYAFQAHYRGDPANSVYSPSDGPCEPVGAADANIQISPAVATNPVGTNHVLTITVNTTGGTLDAGQHAATASIVGGPGSFVGSPSCMYTGGSPTASCTVTIRSGAAGTTAVSASSDVPVNGVTITRTTGTDANASAGGSGNASKNWADAMLVTHVRDALNNDVTNTTVNAGTVVLDQARVVAAAGTPGSVPGPTGTVNFILFSGNACAGVAITSTLNEPLSGGIANSAAFTTPGAGGTFSYQTHYSGDANYPPRDGVCETFTVKPDAAHQLQTLLTAATGAGSGTSLADKLVQVQGYLAAGDKPDACRVLNAFINQVNALNGKKLTPAQAAAFVAQALSIEAALGC